MLALVIICIVILPVLALVFYVVHKSKPGRFRLSATLMKLISINIEVDAAEPTKLPPRTAEPEKLPPGAARP